MAESLRVVIDADAGPLRRELRSGASEVRLFGHTVSGQSRGVAAFNAVAAKNAQNLRAIGRWAKYAAVGVAGFAAYGAARLVKQGIELNASWESAAAGIATFTGSVKSAEAFIERLRKVSAESPLRLTEYEEAARQLMGFGVATKDTIPLLMAMNKAIVATGGGSEELKRVTLSLGQMQAKGKASAEELNQLAEAGVPVNKILQRELHLTGEEVANIGNEGVKSKEALRAIVKGWNEEYAKAYANAQDTFNFQRAKLVKNFEHTLRIASEGLFDELRDGWLPALNRTAEEIGDIWDRPGITPEEKFRKSFETMERDLGPLLDKLGDQIGELDLEEKAVDAFSAALPRMAEAAGRAGLKVAGAFVHGFIQADSLGRLVIGGWLFSKLGGFAAMRAAGVLAGGQIATGMAAGVAGGAGAGGATAGGAAAGGLMGKLKSIRWGRIAKIGIGALLANAVLDEFQRYSKAHSEDVFTALTAQADTQSGIEKTLTGLHQFLGGKGKIDAPSFSQILGLDDAQKGAKNLLAQLEEMRDKRINLSQATINGLKAQLRSLDLNKKARAEIERMLDLAETGRTLHTGVDLGMDPQKLRQIATGLKTLRGGFLTSLHDIQKVMRRTRKLIAEQLGGGTKEGRKEIARNMRAAVKAIAIGMANQEIPIKEGLKRQKQLMRNAKLLEGRDPLGIAAGFRQSWKEAGQISDRERKRTITDLGKMPPKYRQQAFDAMVQYGRGLVRGGKLPERDLRTFTSKALERFQGLIPPAKTSGKRFLGILGGSYGETASAVWQALSNIQKNTEGALQGLGASKIPKFQLKILKQKFGKGASVDVGSLPELGRQEGGVVPGHGDGDRYRTELQANSFVMNREAARAFGFGLQAGGKIPVALEPGERRFTPSEVSRIGLGNLEAMNAAVPRFQQGGIVALGRQLQREGYEVGEHPAFGGVAPVHTGGSYHYKGQALDVNDDAPPFASGGGEPGSLDRLYRRLQGTEGIVELLWRVADHFDHLHVAMAQGASGFLGGAFNLPRPLIEGPEPLKSLGQGSIDQVRKVALRYIGRHQGAMAGLPDVQSGHLGKAELVSLWRHVNRGVGDANLMAAIALAESSGDPDVTNSRGARGLWQIIPSTASDFGLSYGRLTDPAYNALGAGKILRGQGLGAWEAYENGAYRQFLQRGGRVALQGGGQGKDKEKVPSTFEGVSTGSLSLPSDTPKSLRAVQREIRQRRRQLGRYRRAHRVALRKHMQKTANALQQNIEALEQRLHDLVQQRNALRRDAAKKRIERRLGRQLGRITGYEGLIEGAGRRFDRASATAEQIVGLEPQPSEPPGAPGPDASEAAQEAFDRRREDAERAYVDQFTGYVNTQERPAYEAALDRAGDWRNTILRAEMFGFGRGRPSASQMEHGWERGIRRTQRRIGYINDYGEKVRRHVRKWRREHPGEAFPGWLETEIRSRDRLRRGLPTLRHRRGQLRDVLGQGRELFWGGVKHPVHPPQPPRPGTGSFEEALEEVQGAHWPGLHQLVPKLPAGQVPGSFGGVIWDTQDSIRQLDLKIAEAGRGLGEGASGAAQRKKEEEERERRERQERLEELRTQLARERTSAAQLTAANLQELTGFLGDLRGQAPFLGAFMQGTGGRGVPRSGLAVLHRGEMVQPDPKGPAGSQFASGGLVTQQAPMKVELVFKDRSGDLVQLIDARIDGRTTKIDKAIGRRGRQLAVAPGG